MRTYRFKAVLQNDGWYENTCIRVNSYGLIEKIGAEKEFEGDEIETVNGFALPGFQNTHSHAFQYAMAGVTEVQMAGNSADDFWSWRETMYQLALTMDPEDVENIAAMLYSEMVQHGYTHVAEFHYLHHDKNGKPYANLAEHGDRLIAAAEKAGIRITLVPMFYQKGGFDQAPQERQRRFISSTTDEYWKLLEASNMSTLFYDGASIAYGIHSLRAVSSDDIITTIEQGPKGIPFHIHIAEQLKEVEDCKAHLGARPVEWLLNNVNVNHSFHLVHATHLTNSEIINLAKSGAHVVVCPSTEGNLGDGFFRLTDYQEAGGKWSIGTDSHIGLSPLEELRILDYGQRMISHKRNTFAAGGVANTAIEQWLTSGRNAMGHSENSFFREGKPLDAVVYEADSPLLNCCSNKNLLPTIMYSQGRVNTLGTLVRGKFVVKHQHHINKAEIVDKFQQSMKKLNIR